MDFKYARNLLIKIDPQSPSASAPHLNPFVNYSTFSAYCIRFFDKFVSGCFYLANTILSNLNQLWSWYVFRVQNLISLNLNNFQIHQIKPQPAIFYFIKLKKVQSEKSPISIIFLNFTQFNKQPFDIILPGLSLKS